MKHQNTKQRANTRIGPHPKPVLDYMIGNLLGDGSLEHRANATRFVFSQEGRNQEYLHWLHAQYATYGYCSPHMPKQHRRIGKGNTIRWVLRFRTWSYSSLNWLYESFYTRPEPCFPPHRKRIPKDIDQWLTPRSLAVWFMDDGSVSGNPSTGGLKIATQCFSQEDLWRVQEALQSNFQIGSSLHRAKKEQWVLAFGQKDAKAFAALIDEWMHPSMRYKLRFVKSL